MALADDLLEQAHHLAKREPKRPRQASLRRAVSTAYYSLFHLLISSAILQWKGVHQRSQMARGYHLLRQSAAALPEAFESETFDFWSRYLSGAKEQRPRTARCVATVDRQLGDLLGQKYIEL